MPQQAVDRTGQAVLQEEFFSGTKRGDDAAEQLSKARKHRGMIAVSAPHSRAPKVIDSADA